MRLLAIVALAVLLGGTLVGQAIIEYGKTAAATTGAAGTVKSVGASVGKIFEKVSGTMAKDSGTSPGPAPAAAVASSRTAGTGTAAPAAIYALSPSVSMPPKPSKADFAGVEMGMTRDELIAKVGKPSFSTTSSGPDGTVEVLEYDTKEGPTVKVRVAGGRVFAIDKSNPQIAEISGPGFVDLAGKK